MKFIKKQIPKIISNFIKEAKLYNNLPFSSKSNKENALPLISSRYHDNLIIESMISFLIQDDDKYKSLLSQSNTDILIDDITLIPNHNKLMIIFSNPLSRKYFLEKINQNGPKNILVTQVKWNLLIQISNIFIQSITAFLK